MARVNYATICNSLQGYKRGGAVFLVPRLRVSFVYLNVALEEEVILKCGDRTSGRLLGDIHLQKY